MSPERLAEIREMLPVVEPIEGVELRGNFPVEDAAADLLVEVDRLAAENDALFAREAACMTDLEAIGTALGWQPGEYTYPGLVAGVVALRAEVMRLERLVHPLMVGTVHDDGSFTVEPAKEPS